MVVVRKHVASILSSSLSPVINIVFIKDVRSSNILNFRLEEFEMGLLESNLEFEEEVEETIGPFDEPLDTKTWFSMQELLR